MRITVHRGLVIGCYQCMHCPDSHLVSEGELHQSLNFSFIQGQKISVSILCKGFFCDRGFYDDLAA